MNKTTYLSLCVLVCWLALSSGQEPNATLSIVTLRPCSGTIRENVSLYKSDIYTLVNNMSLCGDNWNPNATNVSILQCDFIHAMHCLTVNCCQFCTISISQYLVFLPLYTGL